MNQDIATKVASFFATFPVHLYKKRQIILRAEETPSTIFYLVEGRVSQYDITPTGNEMVVNIFKPGAFFPMSSAINSSPSQYFFEASTNVTVRQAPPATVVQFLKDNPDVLFDLLARVYKGMDGVLRRMAHLMGGDAQSRLLFELLNAAYRFGEPQADGSVFIKLSETDIARHSGLARETVSRTIKNLKAEDVLTLHQHGILIKDVQKLESTLGNKL